MKIISGGQIGADIAGLRAAKKLGFETGGWMPKGWKTKDGPKPEYRELYGMQETTTEDYPSRTKMNVLASDATLRFAYNFRSAGELCTLKWLEFYRSPYRDIRINRDLQGYVVSFEPSNLSELRRWLNEKKVEVLNIAGNADKRIEQEVEEFLWYLLRS